MTGRRVRARTQNAQNREVVHGYTYSQYCRNPEIKRQMAVFLGMGAALVLSAMFFEPKAAVFAAVAAGVFGVWHFADSFLRYRRLARLGADIDDILHKKDVVLLTVMEEGELSILENEVNKMLTRLRDSNLELNREKNHLADSLADLSHQLRTPFTSMNLVLSMLMEDDIPKEKQTAYYRKLSGLLEKVQWLIEVMLKLSRLDAGAVTFLRQTVTVEELLQEALLPFEIALELKEIRLEMQVAEQTLFCGDKKWTAEAIANMVKNSMEHTPAGGTITISAAENPLYTQIVIADNGKGAATEELPHLFERFYKGENSSADSVGIGLALSHKIITGQDGTLKAENIPSGGLKFSMRFYKNAI